MDQSNDHVFSRQDRLLMQLQQAKVPVCIYLRSGVKLQGLVVNFDSHVVILRSASKDQMLFKRTILTIIPSLPSHA